MRMAILLPALTMTILVKLALSLYKLPVYKYLALSHNNFIRSGAFDKLEFGIWLTLIESQPNLCKTQKRLKPFDLILHVKL